MSPAHGKQLRGKRVRLTVRIANSCGLTVCAECDCADVAIAQWHYANDIDELAPKDSILENIFFCPHCRKLVLTHDLDRQGFDEGMHQKHKAWVYADSPLREY